MVGTPFSEAEIRELLVEEKMCWLATISPKGEPHLIPIHFGFFDGNGHIIFVNKRDKSVRNIESNPSVCFGINVGERAGKIKCVLIHGKAKIIDNLEMSKKARLKILTKYSPSGKEAEDFLQKLIASGAIRKKSSSGYRTGEDHFVETLTFSIPRIAMSRTKKPLTFAFWKPFNKLHRTLLNQGEMRRRSINLYLDRLISIIFSISLFHL